MGKNLKKEQISTNHFGAWKLIPHSPFFKGGLRGILLNQFMGCILLAALMCGCGYSTRSLISRDISSIHIPIFGNTTFRRGVEFDLTKAVKDEVMSKTNLRIASKDYADTILEGTIREFKEGIITHGFGDSVVEARMTLFVDIQLVDRRTDRTLVAEKGISQTTEYIVRRGETLESAIDEGVVDLAETIVNLLAEKW
ncbi:MAG: LPS assembly lipoprotein LptE [Candidatus Scalinduaceae bacterium]